MDECPNCKDRPLTPSQRQEARRKAAARARVYELMRKADEEYKKSPQYESMQKWIKATTTIRPEDMRRIVR